MCHMQIIYIKTKIVLRWGREGGRGRGDFNRNVTRLKKTRTFEGAPANLKEPQHLQSYILTLLWSDRRRHVNWLLGKLCKVWTCLGYQPEPS